MAITGGVAIAGGVATQAYFGGKSAKAAKKASRNAAAELARARGAALGYQQPYYQSGTGGLNALSGLLTGKTYNPQGQATTLGEQERADLFQKSPGYQFRLEQAQNALTASQAAKGGLLSGGAMKEMNAYTQGIASDEYGNYINQLQGLAGMGQNAANSMSNIELGVGSGMADYTQQAGMAGANQYQNMGNLIGGQLTSVGGTVLGAALAEKFAGGKGGISANNWNGGTNRPAFDTQLKSVGGW